MSIVAVGRAAPSFDIPCVDGPLSDARRARLVDYAGRWLVLIFYPRDFSFVCPTELTTFSARLDDFEQQNADLLGVSVDSLDLHRDWLTTPAARGGLAGLRFPLASDSTGDASQSYGVWVPEKEVSTRGLFVIDPAGLLQYAVVHNLSVGRSADEVLRVLAALSTGGLCPASWTRADGTIDVERALEPGRILGHYRIQERLGMGTFGSVFAAWDLRLERLVALKVLRHGTRESRETLLAEARAAARLNHPGVCTIYSVEEEDGLPLITMEFLSGRPLSVLIGEGLPPGDRLRLAHEIAAGLAAAHAGAVVHGDLKPANVFITSDGAAKLLDFGLARSQMVSGANGETPTSRISDDPEATLDADAAELARPVAGGLIRGTPAYMSPEAARGEPATPAGDVFSFGLLLFEMFTGRRAIEGASAIDILLKLREQNVAEGVIPAVDEPWRPLFARMIAPDPAERPAMAEVAARLLQAA